MAEMLPVAQSLTSDNINYRFLDGFQAEKY